MTVLRDLIQAARYADRPVVMRQGKIVTTNSPHDVLTAELMEDVFDLRCPVVPDPVTGTPGGTTRLASLCQLVVSMKETTHIGCFSFNKEPCINRIISTSGIV